MEPWYGALVWSLGMEPWYCVSILVDQGHSLLRQAVGEFVAVGVIDCPDAGIST